MTNSQKAEIHDKLDKIRSAGRSAEALGWLVLAIGTFNFWLWGSTVLLSFILWAAALLLALWFIFSGKRIRYGPDKNTGRYLLANGFTSLLGATGIIPLIVSIQSFVNFVRYRRLVKKYKPSINRKVKPPISAKEKIAFSIIFLVSLVSLGLRINNGNYIADFSNTPASEQSAVYKAEKDRFTINFPGTPEITSGSTNVEGVEIPYTTYDSTINDGGQEFGVIVYNWPLENYDFGSLSDSDVKTNLHSTLTALVEELNGTLVSSSYSTFIGHRSEDGHFSYSDKGTTFKGEARVFTIGNDEYVIFAANAEPGEFNAFADSFQHTDD